MKVLVILAAYNGEKYIMEQIDSILGQYCVEIYLTIFDDGSVDETCVKVSKYQDYTERVKLVRNSSPTGSAARNFFNALVSFDDSELQEYDFIAFADQDDIWLPEKMDVATQMLCQKNADLYLSNLILWEERHNRKTIINKSHSQKKYDYLFEGGSAGCTYVFGNAFALDLKKSILNLNHRNWHFFSHDWFVYFFARMNGYLVFIDESAHILYRVHEKNVHGHLNTFSYFAIRERLKLIRRGWYLRQAEGFMSLCAPNSEEYRIYTLYTKNYFTRMFVLLRYNFSLIRSPFKAFQFFLVSLLPTRLDIETRDNGL